MLVKLLVGLAGSAYVLDPGDEFHFPDDEAVRLIEAGHAIPVSTEQIERAVASPALERRKGRGKHVVASDDAVADDGAGDTSGSEAPVSDISQ